MFSPKLKVISIILVLTFIAQDIAWAYPDNTPLPSSQANNKLAPASFFLEKESPDRVLAKITESTIDKNLASLKYKPTLRNAILTFLAYRRNYPTWFNNTGFTIKDKNGNVLYSHIKEIDIRDVIKLGDDDFSELIISINPGFVLRYFNPKIKAEANDKYPDSPAAIPINEIIHKQFIKTKMLTTDRKPKEPPKERPRHAKGAMGLEPFFTIIEQENFGSTYKDNIEDAFEKYFDANNPDYYKKLFKNDKDFKETISGFISNHEQTAWLRPEGRDALINAMYERYKSCYEANGEKLLAKKKEFFKDLVLLLEFGRSIRSVLYNQVEPALIQAGMKDIITYNISFTYDKKIPHLMFFKDGSDVLYINLYEYYVNLHKHNESERDYIFSSLRSSMLYTLVLRYETGEVNSFPRKQSLKGTAIENRYLKGVAFDRELLSVPDKGNIEEPLTRVVSEWTAYMLTLSPTIRGAGIRRRLKDVCRRLSAVPPHDAVLEIAARAAITEITETSRNREDYLRLINYIAPEDTQYFNRLKEEFIAYLKAIRFKNDFRPQVLPQEYFKKLFALMDSFMPEKRAADLLYGENGRFDNITLQGKEDFTDIMTPAQIGRKIRDYFSKDVPAGAPKMGGFTIKYVSGYLALFDIFPMSPKHARPDDPNKNKNDDIQYTLRGAIELLDDGTYEIIFQGADTRDPARFMQQHGYNPDNYTEVELDEVILNEVIIASRIFIEAEIAPNIRSNMFYRDEFGGIQRETGGALLNLANCSLNRAYIYPPVNNHDFVPQSLVSTLCEMLSRYNYVKVKQTHGMTLNTLESEFIRAVENLAVLPDLLKAFPLYGMVDDISLLGLMDYTAYINVVRNAAQAKGVTAEFILAIDGGPKMHGGVAALEEAERMLSDEARQVIDRAITIEAATIELQHSQEEPVYIPKGGILGSEEEFMHSWLHEIIQGINHIVAARDNIDHNAAKFGKYVALKTFEANFKRICQGVVVLLDKLGKIPQAKDTANIYGKEFKALEIEVTKYKEDRNKREIEIETKLTAITNDLQKEQSTVKSRDELNKYLSYYQNLCPQFFKILDEYREFIKPDLTREELNEEIDYYIQKLKSLETPDAFKSIRTTGDKDPNDDINARFWKTPEDRFKLAAAPTNDISIEKCALRNLLKEIGLLYPDTWFEDIRNLREVQEYKGNILTFIKDIKDSLDNKKTITSPAYLALMRYLQRPADLPPKLPAREGLEKLKELIRKKRSEVGDRTIYIGMDGDLKVGKSFLMSSLSEDNRLLTMQVDDGYRTEIDRGPIDWGELKKAVDEKISDKKGMTVIIEGYQLFFNMLNANVQFDIKINLTADYETRLANITALHSSYPLPDYLSDEIAKSTQGDYANVPYDLILDNSLRTRLKEGEKINIIDTNGLSYGVFPENTYSTGWNSMAEYLEKTDIDINNAKMLGASLASFYECDAKKIIYTIRLDSNRVSSDYIELIENYYTKILSSRANNVEIKVLGNSRPNGLVGVEVEIGGIVQGNGTVDTRGDKDQIDSLDRLIGMINFAISVASLPEEFDDTGTDIYNGFLNIILTQYQSLAGEKLALPVNPKDIPAFIRSVALELPRIKPCGVKPQERFKLMEEKLKSAA